MGFGMCTTVPHILPVGPAIDCNYTLIVSWEEKRNIKEKDTSSIAPAGNSERYQNAVITSPVVPSSRDDVRAYKENGKGPLFKQDWHTPYREKDQSNICKHNRTANTIYYNELV
ncbi:hypothetical protein CBL_10520 [Carabus blaptoides fortunei]